jgi:hypothetical protein
VSTVACIVIGASDVAWVTDACCCWVQSTVCYENLKLKYILNTLEAKLSLQFMEEMPDYLVKVEEAVQDSQTRKEISRY